MQETMDGLHDHEALGDAECEPFVAGSTLEAVTGF
jgi:hypothetical protein